MAPALDPVANGFAVWSSLGHDTLVIGQELEREEPLAVEADATLDLLDAILAARDRYRGVAMVTRVHPSPVFEDSDWAMSHGFSVPSRYSA